MAIWENYITQGVNGWMYTGWNNPIYMNYVSSNVGSNMDFHAATYNSKWPNMPSWYHVYAETNHFLGNGTNINTGSQGIPVSSWYYTEIYINNDEFLLDSFSNAKAQGTIYHEMGHAFGLKHNNTNEYSIMCQSGGELEDGTQFSRQVETIQYTDNQAVVNLYGG